MSELIQLQEMMTELIRIVGNTNAKLEAMGSDTKKRFDQMETRFEGLDGQLEGLNGRLELLEHEVKQNHLEVMGELKILRDDLEFQQQKTSQNERDIYRIKKLITG